MADSEKKTVEEMFETLESTIEELEKDDVSLERAFSLYEEGMKLVKSCEEEIDTVEKKVLALNKGETYEFN